MDSALYSYRSAPRANSTSPAAYTPTQELSKSVPLVSAPCPGDSLSPCVSILAPPAKPLVAVGDRVLKGQLIGEAQGTLSATIHASSSGTVIALEERPVPMPPA